MPASTDSRPHSVVGPFLLILGIVALAAAAFAGAAGWFSPARLTPDKFIVAFNPPPGASLGHRRNHAKGICVTGVFDSNGAGTELSRAQVFSTGQYPVVGRFNLGSPNPDAADATVRVRGLGIRISTPNGQEWRSAMIDAPFFAASTPQAFYALLRASASKDPEAMPAYARAHPEIGAFAAWANSAPWTGSYAEERYNGLNAFIFSDKASVEHAVRWSLLPTAIAGDVPPEELARRGPDFLEKDLRDRIASGPLRWRMVVTVADPGDPTSDPTRVWPPGRRTVEVGTLEFQQVEAERDGPCRDLNFDPTVLPDGIRTSDDPFPAARSSVYAKSYDLRTAEYRHYPRTAGTKP